MKTKRLIELLQEADPTGNLEVCVNKQDIFNVSQCPHYYDGCQEILIRDKKLEPYYDVVGGKYLEKGNGVVIEVLSLKEAISCNPDMEIKYNKYTKKYKKDHNKWRKKIKEILNE